MIPVRIGTFCQEAASSWALKIRWDSDRWKWDWGCRQCRGYEARSTPRTFSWFNHQGGNPVTDSHLLFNPTASASPGQVHAAPTQLQNRLLLPFSTATDLIWPPSPLSWTKATASEWTPHSTLISDIQTPPRTWSSSPASVSPCSGACDGDFMPLLLSGALKSADTQGSRFWPISHTDTRGRWGHGSHHTSVSFGFYRAGSRTGNFHAWFLILALILPL